MPLEVLQNRRSAPTRLLADPAPDDAQIAELVRAAIRVPDHGKLEAFRIILIRGDARAALGDALEKIHAQNEPELPEQLLAKDRSRFAAPLNLIVVARTNAAHKVPVIEQQLCAGLVAYNLLIGAQALGFGGQWLTGWAAYDRKVAELLGLESNEHVIAFVSIGTPTGPAPELRRPQLENVLAEWTP